MTTKTIFERNLESLFRQTDMNADVGYAERTVKKYITKPMRLGEHPVYPKTSQLESNLRYAGTGETQKFLYPPMRCNRPAPEAFTHFNYGIHQNITTKPIDVSGTMIQNNELKVRTNRGADSLYRPQIIARN